jgi:hypothetical protein
VVVAVEKVGDFINYAPLLDGAAETVGGFIIHEAPEKVGIGIVMGSVIGIVIGNRDCNRDCNRECNRDCNRDCNGDFIIMHTGSNRFFLYTGCNRFFLYTGWNRFFLSLLPLASVHTSQTQGCI